jgi:large subunit ribosomal protein L11
MADTIPRRQIMTKKQKTAIVATIKMILKAGKATPAYPVGPTLGGYGINIGAVVKEYNERTAHQVGLKVPVVVTIYGDRSFSLQILQPTTSALLRRAAGVDKGSGAAGHTPVGRITQTQLYEIAQLKLVELNANDIEAAMRTVAGTARSMGIVILDEHGRELLLPAPQDMELVDAA